MLDVFLDPRRLGERLAEEPRWALPLALGAVLVALQVALIPVDVWEVTFREMMLRQGRDPAVVGEVGASFLRWSGAVGGALSWLLFAVLLSGVLTVVFAFVLGDRGRFVHHLALVAHAWLIPASVGLLLVPLRIAQEDPQLLLSVGTFLPFLDDGYLATFLGLLDLSQLWALLVVAQGVAVLDTRRSFPSAAVILMALNLVLALVAAVFIPA